MKKKVQSEKKGVNNFFLKMYLKKSKKKEINEFVFVLFVCLFIATRAIFQLSGGLSPLPVTGLQI
jgi:hypothetical protein